MQPIATYVSEMLLHDRLKSRFIVVTKLVRAYASHAVTPKKLTENAPNGTYDTDKLPSTDIS